MSLEDRILSAQKDQKLCDDIIIEYKNFILSSATKSVGRYIDDSEDEFSIAMIAFHEAIQKYKPDRGSFLNFARMVIKNRIIDYQRKQENTNKVTPFSELSKVDQDGSESLFDVEDKSTANLDAKYEIEALTEELKQFDISFFELPKVTPKSQKTKKACFQTVTFIINNSFLTFEVKNKGILPIKVLSQNLKINRKVIERHRKYILSAVVILTGDYTILQEYFKNLKEV